MSVYCALDFGTSNSAIAVPIKGKMQLVEVEKEQYTLPTALFFDQEDAKVLYGREAIQAYVEGNEGRLIRSMKSILGTELANTSTELVPSIAMPFLKMISLFLAHLKEKAELAQQASLQQVVLGRPVFFIDDDAKADIEAQKQLQQAAEEAGFKDVIFQYEPIAAAFDFEAKQTQEKIVLVIDIGGGTADFSLVRVGPKLLHKLDRKDDVLGHHGVHIAGTDYDKKLNLSAIMPYLGYGEQDPQGRILPNRIYFDLASWHLINTLYTPKKINEIKMLKHLYLQANQHQRLMSVLQNQLGHLLAAKAEMAKIQLSSNESTSIDLSELERDLSISCDLNHFVEKSQPETDKIIQAAQHTVNLSGVRQIDALYFTGGSSQLSFLNQALRKQFPDAESIFGHAFSSVTEGLGIYAIRLFGK